MVKEVKEVINVDDEVWQIKEIKDGLPIFESGYYKECYPVFNYNYPFCDEENAKYRKLLIETENDEWMDTFDELCNKFVNERKLRAWADMWYQALDGADYSNTDEDGELYISYFNEFQMEYMLNHKDEVRERLERTFDDHEVVDWWFDDEPILTLQGEGDYSYDVFDLVVKFGKELED